MGCDHTRALDPDLVCEILKRISVIDRLRNVPLVSLRFSQACQDPALWPNLRVQCTDSWTEDHYSSFLRWLVPRASGLRTLHFDHCENDESDGEGAVVWGPRLQDIIAVLAARGPQLRTLLLRYPYPDQEFTTAEPPFYFPLADLKHLSQLTSLTLGVGQTLMESASLATALRGLPALEHLDLTCTCCAWEECLVSVATSCPQLTCLQIGSGCIDNEGRWEQPLVAPEELGLLTNLVELTIANLQLCSLPDSISKLISLQRLTVDDHIFSYEDIGIAVALPSGLNPCRQLSQLRITSDKASPVLADLKFLRQLQIPHCAEFEPREMYWSRLTGLTELKLGEEEYYADYILDGLVGMTGLRKLTCTRAIADNLPEGPYLNALESLCFDDCDMPAGLPSNIAAATKLRRLEWTHDADQCPEIFFSLLEPLHALERLHLSRFMSASNSTWDIALTAVRK